MSRAIRLFTVLSFTFLSLLHTRATAQVSDTVRFVGRTVATGIVIPWEIKEGPDGMLWVSERNGLIERIHPDNGLRDTILDIRDIVYLTPEHGLLGFDLHPNFVDTPMVVVAYVTKPDDHPIRTVSKFIYDGSKLTSEEPIFVYDPAGNYHQGCRILFAPDRTLFISMGDQPEFWRTMDSSSPAGKILHLNLDGSIPSDNPFATYPMWTSGHRNVQGLLFLPNGTLLSSEHGNAIEDEINIVKKGSNYGWPLVEGPCNTEDELLICSEYHITAPFWSTGEQTLALSDMAFYNSDRYPSLKNSILMATLKNSALMRLSMNETFDSITSASTMLQRAFGRIRDVCVTKDGRIFISTSNHDIGAYYPFPRADDDRIIELIPIADTCTSVLAMPDTVDLGPVVVGDSAYFNILLGNTGCAPLIIAGMYVQSSPDTGSMEHKTWRVPFTIMPGETYGIEVMYRPRTEGIHLESMLLDVKETPNPGTRFFWMRGNTTGGFLQPLNDTETDTTMIDGVATIEVSYENIGNVAVTVDSLSIVGPHAAEFTSTFIPPFVVQPSAQFDIRIKHNPVAIGLRRATVRLNSDAYRDQPVELYSTVIASGVEDELVNEASAEIVREYVVDLLGRVVDVSDPAPGSYYRVTVTRRGVTCSLLHFTAK